MPVVGAVHCIKSRRADIQESGTSHSWRGSPKEVLGLDRASDLIPKARRLPWNHRMNDDVRTVVEDIVDLIQQA